MRQDEGWFEKIILPFLSPERVVEAKKLKRQVVNFLQDAVVCITPNLS